MADTLDWLEVVPDTLDWFEVLAEISLKMLTDDQSVQHVMAQHIVHSVHDDI